MESEGEGARREQADRFPGDVGECLVLARQANTHHDLALERRLLEHAETRTGTPDEEASVQRRLAVLDWKYFARWDDARERLLRLAARAVEPAGAWLALARMEHASEDWRALRSAAGRARETADSELDRRRALVRWNQAAVEEAVAKRLEGASEATPELHAAAVELRAAAVELRDYVARHSGYLTSSRQLLRAALLCDDGPGALLGIHSYLHLTADGVAPNAIADAANRLRRLLPGWRGAAASGSEHTALVEALAGSRFFLEAAIVAHDPAAPAELRGLPSVVEILAYERYVRSLEELAEEHYRKTSIGEGDPTAFRSVWNQLTTAAVREIAGDGHSANTDAETRQVFLERRFGAHIRRSSDGYLDDDVFMGHSIVDETRTVEQYGHRAQVRFVALDLMVTNGFGSWAWESGAKNGGWGHGGGIWQVRPAYVQGPLEVWRRLRSTPERQKFEDEMAKETTRDERRAASAPHAHLRGLSMRLHYGGVLEVLEGLRSAGFDEEELRLAFLSEYRRAIVESNFFAHEGRHVIDSLRGEVLQPWQRELGAKLSQIVFAPVPRLAFLGILLDNLGDGTAHGDANLEVVRGLVAWMERHASEIEGFDPERPTLPQLDRLSAEQLRSAARSMDPLAAVDEPAGYARPSAGI